MSQMKYQNSQRNGKQINITNKFQFDEIPIFEKCTLYNYFVPISVSFDSESFGQLLSNKI